MSDDDLRRRVEALEREVDSYRRLMLEELMPRLSGFMETVNDTTNKMRNRIDAAERRISESLETARMANETAGSMVEVVTRAIGDAHTAIVTAQTAVANLGELREDLEAMSRGASAAQLLDYYERRVGPAGRKLSDWLREIKAEDQYRAIVALRSRRKKSRS